MKALITQHDGRLALSEDTKGQPIVLSPAALTAALVLTIGSYSERKELALAAAKAVKGITDEASLHQCKQAQGALAGVRIDAEKDRKDFTAPFLDSQRFIKEQFDLFTAGMSIEEKRLTQVMQDYAAEVERKRQDAIRAAQKLAAEQAAEIARQQAEIARLEREAQDAARRAADAQAAQQSATTAAARRKADEEARAAAAAAEAAKEKADDATFDAEIAALDAVETVELPKGVGRAVLDYELEAAGTRHEDASIRKFAAVYPQFCKIELRRGMIVEELNNGGCFGAGLGEIPKVPGLRVFEKFKVNTRAVR